MIETDIDFEQRSRRAGYLVLLVFFGGFGSWAAFAPLESSAHGRGKVQVEGSSQPVQHLEGGIVSVIYASNGDFVEKGQALIKLDDTRPKAELDIYRGRQLSRLAVADRLTAERDELGSIVFSEGLLNSVDERALPAMENETAIFQARLADRLGERSVLESRIANYETRIEGATAVLHAKKEVTASLEEEIVELEGLLADGFVDKQRIRELKRGLVKSLGEVADLEASIAASRVSIGETELQILQLEKKFKNQVVNALTKTQAELYDIGRQLLAVEDRVRRTTIVAPTAGVVVGLDLNTQGAVVAAGQELLTIVPDTDKLVISAQLSPMDIDRIRVGQEVEVRFSVFKDAYTISGTLIKVSADSLIDEVTGRPYYGGLVELLESDLPMLGEYELVPGMPAEVLVKTGSRSFLAFLTSRMGNMFAQSLNQD